MTDLVGFLRARLDEDEAAALAAFAGPWTVGAHPDGIRSVVLSPYARVVATTFREADAAHVARHDPARVLADVAAKRAILDMWEDPEEAREPGSNGQEGRDADEIEADVAVAYAITDIVAAFAAVYAGHPDYREEWTP